MTLRLTVDDAAWTAHVAAVAGRVEGIVPVVKGNGYGFGRDLLAGRAAAFADEVAVGSVHEAHIHGTDTESLTGIVVLTPTTAVPARLRGDDRVILTVGSTEHVRILRRDGWSGRVAIKLASSMQRYGTPLDEVGGVLDAVRDAGFGLHSFMLHLPLAADAGADARHISEIESLIPALDPAVALSVSHVSTDAFRALVGRHRGHQLRLRMGTALWHGDKSFLRLESDVTDVREARRGSLAGYHAVRVNDDAVLVMVGCGSAHGVASLPDGRSPFHFRQTRLTLLEPPHMHTSIVLMGRRQPVPDVGEWVDVQRPLITTAVDEVMWR